MKKRFIITVDEDQKDSDEASIKVEMPEGEIEIPYLIKVLDELIYGLVHIDCDHDHDDVDDDGEEERPAKVNPTMNKKDLN